MHTMLVYLFISSVVAFDNDDDLIKNYLQNYGYLPVTATHELSQLSITNGLRLFQEHFNLNQTDGKITAETLEIMKTPRCGNKDDLSAVTEIRKWTTNDLRWYSYDVNIPINIVEKAFNVWTKHANLTVTRSRIDPHIIIAFLKDYNHNRILDKQQCIEFRDDVLAHASFPGDYNTSEIHFNELDHMWLKTMVLPNRGNSERSFFQVLVHEIGHSLGLNHDTSRKTNIMYPSIQTVKGIQDMNEYELDSNGILQIQQRYGMKPKVPVIVNKTDEPVSEVRRDVDICKIRYDIQHVLIVNNFVYFFHNIYLWQVALLTSRRSDYQMTRPLTLTEWLTFLPKETRSISSIYQNQEGNIVLFIDRMRYTVHYPSLRLLDRRPVSELTGGLGNIRDVFASYTNNLGNTILLGDRNYVLQMNTCTDDLMLRGVVDRYYLALHYESLGSAFRHTNGKMYFFNRYEKYLIEYDEFIKGITGRVDSALDLFKITCTEDTLLADLYNISSKLLLYKDRT